MILLKNQIILDESYQQEPKNDLIRVQKALFLHRDIYCTLDECGNIWQNYSSSLCASWMDIPNELIPIINRIECTYDFTSYDDWSVIND